MGMAATRRTRASSGNNVLLLLAIGLVFSAASTTTPAVAAAALNGSDDDIGAAARAAGLSVDFHAASCPDLDGIVRSAVEEARRWDAQVTAGLLRIFFHDCFPQGCDASILLGRNQGGSEQDAPQNTGLQQAALDLVERIRGRVHSVSCKENGAREGAGRRPIGGENQKQLKKEVLGRRVPRPSGRYPSDKWSV
jgi:hypothetical protein